jgi:hypothetical protein
MQLSRGLAMGRGSFLYIEGLVLIKLRLFGNRWLPRTTGALRRGFRRFSDAVATSVIEEW